MKRIAGVAFLTLFVAALGQSVWHYAHLPAQVATHFNYAGKPTGWMSREALLGFQLAMILLVGGLLEGIVRLNRRIPDEGFNIPHRDYWLHPERRPATVAWIGNLVRVAGCGVLAFFLFLFHQVYRANLGSGDLTASTAVITGIALVGIVALLIACLVRFARRPAA
jgi:hypothetical protein